MNVLPFDLSLKMGCYTKLLSFYLFYESVLKHRVANRIYLSDRDDMNTFESTLITELGLLHIKFVWQ